MRAVQMGKRGEAYVRAVRDIGPKSTAAIRVAGRDRIPDGMTPPRFWRGARRTFVTCPILSNSRSYAAFAQNTGRRFDLYVRTGTKLSGPLDEAAQKGLINIIPLIP